MSAILTALRSEAINRLTLTYEKLPKDVKNMMERMEALNGSTNGPYVPVLSKHVTCWAQDLLLTERIKTPT
jgi:hypothetical protein